MAFTREPSARRASTMGEDSSTRRPTRETMRSMICMRCPLSLNDKPGQFKLASALDVDLVEAIDQDVGDGVVLEQGLERPEAKDFVEDFAGQAFAFGEAERNDLAVDGVADENENFFAGAIAVSAAKFFQVEAIEDLAMQVRLYLLVLAVLTAHQAAVSLWPRPIPSCAVSRLPIPTYCWLIFPPITCPKCWSMAPAWPV